MRLGSLFAGIGGIELGLEPFGIETVWQVEYDSHASQVLAQHWPGVPNYGDITAVDWHAVEPVDVLCGGFPCQDISLAGKGAGIVEGTRSGLWSYFANAIGVLRPRFVLIENVSALAVRGLDRVLCDLAEIGFDAEWQCVRASDVGAPHRRERLFILARNTDEQPGEQRREPTPGQAQGRGSRTDAGRSGGAFIADTEGQGRERRGVPVVTRSAHGQFGDQAGEAAPDTDSPGLIGVAQLDREASGGLDGEHRRHADGRCMEVAGDTGVGIGGPEVSWGDYELAIRRWEALTRHAPPPTDERGRLAPEFVEWLMGFPEGWTDGLPRSQRLKCLGNAVVPQCGALAWELLS